MCVIVMTINSNNTTYILSEMKNVIGTIRHKTLSLKDFCKHLIQGKCMIRPTGTTRDLTTMLIVVKVVSKCNSIARCNRQYFTLTIAVKCCPLNRIRVLAPIEYDLASVMTNCKLSPCMRTWKTNNQRSELMFRSRGVDMRFELVMRSFVNLPIRCIKLRIFTLSL